MTVSIRSAEPADAAEVGRLVYALLTELNPERAMVLREADFPGRAERLLAMTDRVWGFLAIDEGRPIAVMMLNECAAIYADGAFGEISELYVEPAYRSAGVAPKLLQAAIDLAEKRQWPMLEVGAPRLPVWQRTVDFYLRQGFEATGPRLKLRL